MNHFQSICIAAALTLTAACSGSETKASETASGASGTETVSGPTTAEIESADTDGVMDLQKDIIADSIEILKSITDKDSAKAALPKLQSIAERVKPLLARRKEIKSGNPMDVLAFGQATMALMPLIKPLNEQGERLQELGVNKTLEPVMKQILSIFKPSN